MAAETVGTEAPRVLRPQDLEDVTADISGAAAEEGLDIAAVNGVPRSLP
jgi:hypothetical protein